MKHEPINPNEVFIGNTTDIKNGIPGHLRSLKTVRFGTQAYDLHGKKISQDYMLPLFVDRSEVLALDRIQMERFSQIK